MKYRVIVRISLNKDTKSKFRNGKIKPNLPGFINSPTGTWETAGMDLADALEALASVMEQLAPLTNKNSTHLDHLWIYVDKVKPSEKSNKRAKDKKKQKI
jgi:hypothetical protein